MTKTSLDTAPSLLSPRRQYMQRIRLAWPTNGLTQNCWSSDAETTAKQPHPIYCCEETAPPHYCCEETAPPHYTTHCKTAPPCYCCEETAPPRYCCEETAPPHYTTHCCSNSPLHYPRHHNQAKEARLYTTAKQLKPPAKRAASSAIMVKPELTVHQEVED